MARSKIVWIAAVILAFAVGLGGGVYGPALWRKAMAPIPVTQVAVYDAADLDEGGFNHFSDVNTVLVRADVKPDGRTQNYVVLKLIVAPDGQVTSATPIAGTTAYYADTIALALTWKVKPFLRNGVPVAARVPYVFVRIQPPELRRDYPVPFPPLRDIAHVKITFDRGPCFGECPIYHVVLHGDGTVDYEGLGFVVVLGKHHAKVPVAVVQHLVDEFRKAHFFSLLPRYHASITDNPTYKIAISFDGYAAEVDDYVGEQVGMPHAVSALEDEIDRALETKLWVRGDLQTVPSLIAEGWDFKANSCNNTALVAGAARYASLDVVRALLVQGAPVHSKCSQSGYGILEVSALQSAVEHGDVAMVDALAEARIDDRDAAEALIEAARRGAFEMLIRIEHAHPMRHHIVRLANGETLLMAAAESCVPEAVSEVIDNAEINAADGQGKTALFHARGGVADKPHDCAGTVRLLLAKGADPNARDRNQDTALIDNMFDVDVAKSLLKAGADPNARNFMGRTALMASDDPNLTRALFEGGANPWLVDNEGKNALDLAREGGSQNSCVPVLEAWMKAHPKAHPKPKPKR